MTCRPAMVAEWLWTDDLALVPRGSSWRSVWKSLMLALLARGPTRTAEPDDFVFARGGVPGVLTWREGKQDMTQTQIGKVWFVVGALLFYYAFNTWIVMQGGNEIFGVKLVVSK